MEFRSVPSRLEFHLSCSLVGSVPPLPALSLVVQAVPQPPLGVFLVFMGFLAVVAGLGASALPVSPLAFSRLLFLPRSLGSGSLVPSL